MWLSRKGYIDKIIGANLYADEATGLFEVWITKVNGKTTKIYETSDPECAANYLNRIVNAILDNQSLVEVVE